MGLFRTQKKFLQAVADGDDKTVAAYLDSDPSWAQTAESKTNRYALLLAAQNGRTAIVRRLLKSGAVVWHSDSRGQTALHLAAAGGYTDTVHALLEGDAAYYITTQDHNHLTPLQYAIAGKHPEVLKLFLDTKKADLTAGEKPAVYTAVENRSMDCLAMLLAAGADPNVPRNEIRHNRSHDFFGWVSDVKTTTFRQSPLQCACVVNDIDIARTLLKAGAKTLDDEYPVLNAAAHGNIPLVTALIENGFDPKAANREDRRTALHAAVQAKLAEGLPEMVEFLLAQGVDKDAKDSAGRTALSYAQQYALTDVVKLLQNPAPAIQPLPVIPVIRPTPAAAEPAPPPPPPRPVVAAPPSNDDDMWARSGKSSVVHSTLFPAVNRRLTEIFNFETRERVTITENLSLKTETMGPRETFDAVSDEALQKAFGEFKKLGGNAEESAVFGNRLMKIKIKP